jgi:FixJ family two-component response regulator
MLRHTDTMTDRPPDFIVAVVDDDQRILESLEHLLESAGYAVRLFASAAALLESDSLEEIDCLISDIDLPKIDGFELLRLVYAARPVLPVILITGHPKMVNRSPPIGSGHYRFFKKPFNGQELLAAVKRRCAELTSTYAPVVTTTANPPFQPESTIDVRCWAVLSRTPTGSSLAPRV